MSWEFLRVKFFSLKFLLLILFRNQNPISVSDEEIEDCCAIFSIKIVKKYANIWKENHKKSLLSKRMSLEKNLIEKE
jgi:hypothetical protein